MSRLGAPLSACEHASVYGDAVAFGGGCRCHAATDEIARACAAQHAPCTSALRSRVSRERAAVAFLDQVSSRRRAPGRDGVTHTLFAPPTAAAAARAQHGDRIALLQLQGYLFFGNASQMTE